MQIMAWGSLEALLNITHCLIIEVREIGLQHIKSSGIVIHGHQLGIRGGGLSKNLSFPGDYLYSTGLCRGYAAVASS